MKKAKIIMLSIFIFCIINCSSKPSQPMKIETIQKTAITSLENANAKILFGDFSTAQKLLDNAYTLAMSVDNIDLLIKTSLTNVSLALSYNPPKIENAYNSLNNAESFVEYSTNKKKSEALCKLSEIQIKLAENKTDYESYILLLKNYENFFNDDKYYKAQCLSIYGDIYRLKKDYLLSEKYFLEALKNYTDNYYLSEIGLIWYKIAQVRSLNNQKKLSLEALENAIKYDRACENTKALGTDYYIKGIILIKDQYNEKEKKEAIYAFNHSADIFAACGMEELSNRSRQKAKEI